MTQIDKQKEDAKVIDDNGAPLVLLEFKGISKGIKRKDVGQVNFHRDRADLDMKVPGALIINSDSSISGIKERLEADVPKAQIHYARSLNVLIIRTIDLLFLMRQLEDKNVYERKEILMKLFSSGGGWLKVDDASYEIITS